MSSQRGLPNIDAPPVKPEKTNATLATDNSVTSAFARSECFPLVCAHLGNRHRHQVEVIEQRRAVRRVLSGLFSRNINLEACEQALGCEQRGIIRTVELTDCDEAGCAGVQYERFEVERLPARSEGVV